MRVAAMFASGLSVVLALSGCAALLGSHADYPLRERNLLPALPVSQEVTATLRMSRGDITEEYILALRVTQEGVRAALLSPQGVPQFRLWLQNGTREESSQAPSGELLTAALLADYLQLVYLSEAGINGALKKGWCMEGGLKSNEKSSTQERHLLRACDTQQPTSAYRIRYTGPKPWYNSIEILDAPRGQTLVMTLLVKNNALPE